MKRRVSTYSYIALGVVLFCWMSLPKSFTDHLRAFAVSRSSSSEKGKSDEVSRLQIENRALRSQIEAACEWVLSDAKIKENPFFEKRAAHLQNLLQEQMLSLPAQVVYRDPSSWSSSLWINVGEKDNEAVHHPVIAKNSPVLSNGALVGVVDFVGRKQSRVRLITDSGLSPAVRAVRGASQNRELSQHLASFSQRLEKRDDLFSSSEEKEAFLASLQALKSKIGTSWEDGYLAKGELHGSSAPFWRARSPILKGIGFHFDSPDEKTSFPVPILKEGDLLVTSGLDGVFPPGILVAIVSSIGTQKGYAYEIKARPVASNLNDLQTLFILPSIGDAR
jgi:rod shape-determining protein MreC